MTPCDNCYIIITRSFILEQRKISVVLPNNKLAELTYHKTESGQWVSILGNQSMIDLVALLNGEELKQEYVETSTGDIPSWVIL